MINPNSIMTQKLPYVLLMNISGPMQSWHRPCMDGEGFGTELYPPKSGILNIIKTAVGEDRKDDFPMYASMRYGVRVDDAGQVLTDHEREIDDWTNEEYGYSCCYLCNASFVVGLESDSKELLVKLEAALNAPKAALALGDDSCIPPIPFTLGIHTGTLEDVLGRIPLLSYKAFSPKLGVNESLRFFTEAAPNESGRVTKDYHISYDNANYSQVERHYVDRDPVIPPPCDTQKLGEVLLALHHTR